jgi:hypothetical protein
VPEKVEKEERRSYTALEMRLIDLRKKMLGLNYRISRYNSPKTSMKRKKTRKLAELPNQSP